MNIKGKLFKIRFTILILQIVEIQFSLIYRKHSSPYFHIRVTSQKTIILFNEHTIISTIYIINICCYIFVEKSNIILIHNPFTF